MSISNALGSELVAKIIGYAIEKGDFSNVTPNLPMRIAVLGEANAANQATLSTTPVEITSAKQAAELYGYGSPLHIMFRILRPLSGSGIGGIPTFAYPQAAAPAAASAVRDLTPTGIATANGTHTLVINGRRGIDGVNYDVNIETGDTVADVIGKMISTVSNVLGAPVVATNGTTKLVLTAKWAGKTSEDLNVSVDTNGDGLGLTYAVTSDAVGSGTPAITSSLQLFGDIWNNLVINPYGSDVFADLEAFNGIPDGASSSGRYAGIIMKPFIAHYGDTSTDPSTLTDVEARRAQVTNSVCPAPNSKGWPMEAAANGAMRTARISQDTPHLDVSAQFYADMPIPADGDIGDMADYTFRNSIVQKGSSTVILVDGRYKVEDWVTTYHPEGETPPQFRYVRTLIIDYNIRFAYYLKQQIYVVDHALANDTDTVEVEKVIKPKQWIQELSDLADELTAKALIVEPGFTKDSIEVGINPSNPDRMDDKFSYKRSGMGRLFSTTAIGGFNFGNI